MAAINLQLKRVAGTEVLKDRIYGELKRAITGIDIYANAEEHRLDERQLSEELGVSRTPVREALCRLENEGFVQTIPRRGAFVARKTKKQILEMLVVWAALESMAARLVTERASDREIASLRRMFASYEDDRVKAHIDEYSETNISFHQALFNISHCDLLGELTENLFIHMRSIRMRTIHEENRATRSIKDHLHIIEALEARDADLAERLVRQHTLDLAAHVEKSVDWLD
jgi:DNA-binding GntR family transcriptional regulator